MVNKFNNVRALTLILVIISSITLIFSLNSRFSLSSTACNSPSNYDPNIANQFGYNLIQNNVGYGNGQLCSPNPDQTGQGFCEATETCAGQATLLYAYDCENQGLYAEPTTSSSCICYYNNYPLVGAGQLWYCPTDYVCGQTPGQCVPLTTSSGSGGGNNANQYLSCQILSQSLKVSCNTLTQGFCSDITLTFKASWPGTCDTGLTSYTIKANITFMPLKSSCTFPQKISITLGQPTARQSCDQIIVKQGTTALQDWLNLYSCMSAPIQIITTQIYLVDSNGQFVRLLNDTSSQPIVDCNTSSSKIVA